MANHTGIEPPSRYLIKIDEKLYGLDEEQTAFFKQQTGIQDDELLKQHIFEKQAEAFEVYPYPCIRRFAFTKLKISRLFPYKQFLQLGQTRKNAIYLDIGCCFGNDPRKAIADGYPIDNVIASDLKKEFWDIGHQLFNSSFEAFPVPFIAGDAFDPNHLAIVPPFTQSNPPSSSAPDLKTLTSLNPLHGHVSAIHASSFFHLFREAQQQHLAQALAGLLSPQPGSIIFGQHGALPVKGFRSPDGIVKDGDMFCHSPESWTELWDGGVFAKDIVKVETKLVQIERPEFDTGPVPRKHYMLTWSVTRI